MITDKVYRKATKTKKTVQEIEKALKTHNITHEPVDYEVLNFSLFVFGQTCFTVLTNNCTIEVNKDQITVNEKPVDSVEDMLDEVLAVEG